MRPTNKKQILVLALVSTFFFSACHQVRQVGEMRDSTAEMNKTTKDLLKSTDDLKVETKQLGQTAGSLNKETSDLLKIAETKLAKNLEIMDGNMAELYDALRQGNAAELRRDFFQEIQNSDTLQNQIAAAGLFLMSFEFQLFAGKGTDTDAHRRQTLYHQALMEFFLRLDELAPKNGAVMPEATPEPGSRSERNRASAFNAFAGVLHKVNRKQEIDPEFGHPVSVYDLIIRSLQAQPRMDSGEVVLPEGPHYMKEVLARPTRVVQVLQTRYNMFLYMLLGATTDLSEKGRISQLIKITRGIEISLSPEKMSSAQLQFLIDEVLEPAVRTKNEMTAVGLPPEFTRITKFISSRIRLVRSPHLSTENEDQHGKQEKALALWSEYLGETSPKEKNGESK